MMEMKKRKVKEKLETYGSLLDGSMTYGAGLRLDAWRLVYNFIVWGYHSLLLLLCFTS
jgi:hypothetical protein